MPLRTPEDAMEKKTNELTTVSASRLQAKTSEEPHMPPFSQSF